VCTNFLFNSLIVEQARFAAKRLLWITPRPGPRQDLPRWHSVASGITRPILWLRKAFDVLILLLVFSVPACYLPWARVIQLPLFLVGAYWISILWIFFTSGFSCVSRASGRVRVSRESGSQPSIEQPALAPRSSNNKEQPAALSSSSNDQLPTDSSSSSIAAEPSLRLNGSPGPDLEKELFLCLRKNFKWLDGWLTGVWLAKNPTKTSTVAP